MSFERPLASLDNFIHKTAQLKRVRSGPVIHGAISRHSAVVQHTRNAFDCVDVDDEVDDDGAVLNDLFDVSDVLGDSRLRYDAIHGD